MKERLAEILYKIGLKRIAYRISPKTCRRLMFKKVGMMAHKSTEAFKEFVKVYNEKMNKEKGGGE